jgi:PAS domain S-box-containing protein
VDTSSSIQCGERNSDFPLGGGELGVLIRDFDWSKTSLGPLRAWPQSLKTVTATLLLSPVPIVLLWGEDGLMIYNDAYSIFAGGRHPRLLGSKVREGWPEVSDFNDNVMKVVLAGKTLAYKDQKLSLIRHGRLEPAWMNLDYSPVLDESGKPAGVIAIVVETTQKVMADRRLRESEERFRALTHATSDVVYRMSADWAEMRRLDGRGFLSDTETPSIAWQSEYLLQEDQPKIQTAINEAVRNKGVFQLEHRVRRADNSTGWTFSRAIPLLDDRGEILEWFGSASDVTERRRSEARRDALVRLTAEIQSLDDPGEIAFVASKILGETLRVSRVGYGTVDPADDSLTVERDWNAPGVQTIAGTLNLRDFGSFVDDLKLGKFIAIPDVTLDLRTASAADSLIEQSARSFVNVAVIEKNKTVAVFYINHASVREWSENDLGLIREVAARTRTAIERRRIEGDYRSLAASLELQVEQRTREHDRVWRNTQDLSVITDSNGVFVAVNPAATKILGWVAEEMIGRSVLDFVVPEDVADAKRALEHAAREALPAFENRYRHKQGGFRWIAWVAAPDGDLIYASGRDVTAEKETAEALAASEEALKQAQKMEAVGQLTGGLAHDFNNILAGISGSLDLMQVRMAQGRIAEMERYLTAAQGATKRAAALTHRLLAFSRRQTLDPRPTNINQLVSGMEDLVQRSVGPGIAVETVTAGGLWNTLVDAGLLENALLNLCLNGRDAMPDGGKLTIETANRWLDERAGAARNLPAGQYVSLCVSDNGTGMTPDVAARAFDPFFTTKPIGQGTGLGLSMTYGFARQSGGQVRIYSEVGRGTMVCIYLPRHFGKEETADGEAPRAEITHATLGQTVLMVDDEPLIRMLVIDVLHEHGYSALEAADGSEGLRILASNARLDLLITDVGLPNGMNGRQLADAAREKRPDLKVLFITGYAENASLNHGHLAPGMHVMTKPFAMEALATGSGAKKCWGYVLSTLDCEFCDTKTGKVGQKRHLRSHETRVAGEVLSPMSKIVRRHQYHWKCDAHALLDGNA